MMEEDVALQTTDYTNETATFGDRVTAAREAAGVTTHQLSRQLGVKLKTVENWEADRSEPRANKLQMLAGLLNVSLVWLMTGEGDDGPSLALSGKMSELQYELRAIRAEQLRLAERLAQVSKRIG